MSTTDDKKRTRLQSIQSAVLSQLRELMENDEKCEVSIISFGEQVKLYDHNGTSKIIPLSMFNYIDHLINFGKDHAETYNKTGSSQTYEKLASIVQSLRPSGGTPLGPTLCAAVGIAGIRSGSRVVVCTDGMANVGVGTLSYKKGERSEFYNKIGVEAARRGVSISVVTVADEECSMENLGVTAEVSGGSVDIVDPDEMGSAMTTFVQRKTIGTLGQVRVYANPTQLNVTFPNRPPSEKPQLQKACCACEIPVIDDKSDICVLLEPVGSEVKEEVYMQVQVEYITSHQEKILVVETLKVPTNTNRSNVETNVRTHSVAITAIRYAAMLAALNKYQDARIHLISTQRLLQRVMSTPNNQQDYLGFIVQAEKLDQFMREAQKSEEVFGKHLDRDDEASKSMFSMKNLSLLDFKNRI
jgi:hypothetical protein